MLLVQPRWFDLSLRVCGHDIRPVFHTVAATKRVFFTTAAVYLATTGKLREDSCGRRKERERQGNKKDKQFDLLFLPISSGRPPP